MEPPPNQVVYTPGPDAPPRTGPRPGRAPSRRRRLLIGGALAGVVVVVVVLVFWAYAVVQLGRIRRVTVAGLVPAGSGQAQTILLAGSDSRAGESAAAAQQFGSAAQVSGARSDVIILIHLDPRTAKASMLSIPRDFFVPIAGTGSSNRINVAFDQSPGELVKTISQDLGITVNHFAEEDFSGLQALTDAVGGVCMSFPYPARDGSPTGTGNESGLNIPTAGKHTLNGSMALSLVRSRYYQYYSSGAWRPEGAGDIGRIERQHVFMRALAAKALHSSLHNPFTANRVLGRAVRDVKIDSTFTSTGILRLALHLRSLRPAGIPSWTMPYRAVNGYQGFGDVLMPDPTADAAVIAAWQSYGAPGTAAPTLATSAVSVKVLNGSGVAGQAQAAAATLGKDGFTLTGYSTAPARAGSTTVAYASGHDAAGRLVAGFVLGQVRLVKDSSLRGNAVVLTTGAGFGGVRVTTTGSGSAGSAAPASGTPPPWDPTGC